MTTDTTIAEFEKWAMQFEGPFNESKISTDNLTLIALCMREAWKAATAAKPEQAPAWHDAPTCAGLWISFHEGIFGLEDTITQDAIDCHIFWVGRWYGPIPEDS
jgi:hypothetical protein